MATRPSCRARRVSASLALAVIRRAVAEGGQDLSATTVEDRQEPADTRPAERLYSGASGTPNPNEPDPSDTLMLVFAT
jgi:hypothetical protein